MDTLPERYIFLDVDGVVVTLTSCQQREAFLRRSDSPLTRRLHRFDPDSVQNLNRLIELTGAKIVISSTWRYGSDSDFELLIQHFKNEGVRGHIVGRTTTQYFRERGAQIDLWLNEVVKKEDFIIIDDGSDMNPHSDRLVQTSMETGFTEKHLKQAVALFSSIV
jgi:sporulation protein YlmC with PRC-barrel domain